MLLAAALTLADLEGDWIADRYAEALAKTRSPLAAEEIAKPRAMTIRNGRIDVTSFHEATWYAVRELAPRGGASYDLRISAAEDAQSPATKRLQVWVEKDSFTGNVWGDEPTKFRRLKEPLDNFLRRTLIAGEYTDARGKKWTFGIDGRATSPDRGAFSYRMNLDTSEACTDYFFIGEERVAYRWSEGKLELYRVKVQSAEIGCPIVRETEPLAVLTSTASAPSPRL